MREYHYLGISRCARLPIGMSTLSHFVHHIAQHTCRRGVSVLASFPHIHAVHKAFDIPVLTRRSLSNRYIGLPPSWSSALSQVGFNEDEIAAIHARRLAAATGMAPNTNLPNPHTNNLAELPPPPHVSAVSPPTTSTLSSSVLLAPVPRSTSLRKGRDALTIHPPSVYSVATSSGPPSIIGRTSPAPSPKAPSFSMKSFVSGLKNSLTSDSVSMKEGVGSSRRGEDAMSVESEQYVFVDGEQGMGDEPITELYPYDTASISSHHTHASSIRSQVGSFSVGVNLDRDVDTSASGPTDATNTNFSTDPSAACPFRCRSCLTCFLRLPCTISARPLHFHTFTYPSTWIHLP